MRWFLGIIGGFITIGLITILLISLTPMTRFLKTFYLILTTSPYERIIDSTPEILVIGDSTGYGTGVKNNSKSIVGLIGSDYESYTIKNNSVNGRTIGQAVAEAKNVSGHHELILLQLGGNDILQHREVTVVEGELRNIVALLKDNTDNLLMMSSGNVGGAAAFSAEKAAEYTKLTREFREMFIRVGEDTDLTYVDLFLEPEEDIIANNPEIYLASDGLHPSAAGYAVWYQTLKPVLASILDDKTVTD